MNTRTGFYAILTAAALTMTGCQTLDPYTGESKTSNTVKGAGIGAAAGAVIGLITGDDSRERRKHALIGAGVGAIAGGSVGYYMDKQEAKLREQLAGTGVSVTRQGDDIILNMPSNITFDVDSSAIKGEFFDVLNSVTLVVEEFDKTLIEVMGHTDSSGKETYNQALSERRANAVADYFRSRGVEPLRLAASGYGENYPVADNDTASGRALNRRVEIALVPITQG